MKKNIQIYVKLKFKMVTMVKEGKINNLILERRNGNARATWLILVNLRKRY